MIMNNQTFKIIRLEELRANLHQFFAIDKHIHGLLIDFTKYLFTLLNILSGGGLKSFRPSFLSNQITHKQAAKTGWIHN